jgi:hypothetical protein
VLDHIQEKGVWGFDTTLDAVGEGRIHLLAVPWHMHARVFQCGGGDRVTASRSEALRLYPGETIHETALADVLPALIARHKLQLAVMHGANETRLNETFGGLAGLARW